MRKAEKGPGIHGTKFRRFTLETDSSSKEALLALYQARLHIELDLRAIKSVMQMEVLRCKVPQRVGKEIAVYLLAYNLVRAVMAQAAFLGYVLAR